MYVCLTGPPETNMSFVNQLFSSFKRRRTPCDQRQLLAPREAGLFRSCFSTTQPPFPPDLEGLPPAPCCPLSSGPPGPLLHGKLRPGLLAAVGSPQAPTALPLSCSWPPGYSQALGCLLGQSLTACSGVVPEVLGKTADPCGPPFN